MPPLRRLALLGYIASPRRPEQPSASHVGERHASKQPPRECKHVVETSLDRIDCRVDDCGQRDARVRRGRRRRRWCWRGRRWRRWSGRRRSGRRRCRRLGHRRQRRQLRGQHTNPDRHGYGDRDPHREAPQDEDPVIRAPAPEIPAKNTATRGRAPEQIRRRRRPAFTAAPPSFLTRRPTPWRPAGASWYTARQFREPNARTGFVSPTLRCHRRA